MGTWTTCGGGGMVSQADIDNTAARIAELLPAYRARVAAEGWRTDTAVADCEAWLAGKPTLSQGGRAAVGEGLVIWLMAFTASDPQPPRDGNPPPKA
jgi:hypothetical protein